MIEYQKLNLITLYSAEGVDYSALDAKDPETLTEEEKVALLGRPCLGTNGRIQIRIRESKEFKVNINIIKFFLCIIISMEIKILHKYSDNYSLLINAKK